MNIRYIFITFAALFIALNVTKAQDLDPTVVVNKAYDGKLVQVHKPALEMAVPDSVTRFNLDFDYLVFEQPYKGADAFTPYILNMKPASVIPDVSKLYLNAGAGYTLHPELDFVWSPFTGRKYRMDFYADHRSYFGDYRSFSPDWSNDGVMTLDRQQDQNGDYAYWNGYDLKSKVGVDARYECASLSAALDVSYYGLASKDIIKQRLYDALDVRMNVSSKPKNTSYFKYDILAAYRFAEDKLDYVKFGKDYINEQLFELDAELGQVFSMEHQVLLDVKTDVAAYSKSATGQLTFVPHYVWSKGRWTVDAGIKITAVIGAKDSLSMFGHQIQVAYPDVKASYAVIPDAMRLYAGLGGGSRLNTYASILEKNHHVDPLFAIGQTGLMDITEERISVSLGMEGRIGSIFSYNLRTGYSNYANALFDAVTIDADKQYLPGIGYSACQKYYAALDLRLVSESVCFDGGVEFVNVWGMNNAIGLFAPAMLSGDVSFEYNWRKRIFAGVDCRFATARKGSVLDEVLEGNIIQAKIPGYADLGVRFEYAFSRSFSAWLRGGNLLNMTVQRNPLYAEKGTNLTVGICLNL